MGERISTQRITREKGWLYYIDKQGYISRVPLRGGRKQRVSSFKVPKAPGYIYYVDKAGYIAKAKMRRGRKKKKGKHYQVDIWK